MKARLTDEQIIAMFTEQEAGEKTADVCRRDALHGRAMRCMIPRMEPSDAKRLRALEDMNAKLKKLLPEQLLECAIGSSAMANAMLRYINSNRW